VAQWVLVANSNTFNKSFLYKKMVITPIYFFSNLCGGGSAPPTHLHCMTTQNSKGSALRSLYFFKVIFHSDI
ncbi:MAG: hypothetical protein ACK48A_06415, partial [Pseudanabaena sp.]